MKNLISILVIALVFQTSFSQNCEDISPYKKDMQLEYTNYTKKGKVKDVETYHITDVENTSGNLAIHINATSTKDKKDTPAKHVTLKCDNGNFLIDMREYLSHQDQQQNSELTVKATGDFMEFPNDISSGMSLKDTTIELSIGNQEASVGIFDMTVSNRKVIQEESITLKAGTFKGYKMSFDYVFSLGIIKFRGKGIEWYVKGVGIVKSENYSKKGKLRWYRELTKISE